MKTAVLISLFLVTPSLALAQHTANGAPSVGTAVPAGSSTSDSGSSSSGGSTSSGSSGGEIGHSAINGHRPGNTTHSTTAASDKGVFTNYSQLSPSVPPFSRPRNGLPIVGYAVPRSSAGNGGGGGTIIWGTYNPWFYAYDGFADTALFDEYDPFASGTGYVTVSTPSETGVLRLNVKPPEAEVYVDGGLAGSVEQFEGLFHKLRLEAGVHRVELRAVGYLPVVVNVRIEPGQTVTYRGTLDKTAP